MVTEESPEARFLEIENTVELVLSYPVEVHESFFLLVCDNSDQILLRLNHPYLNYLVVRDSYDNWRLSVVKLPFPDHQIEENEFIVDCKEKGGLCIIDIVMALDT